MTERRNTLVAFFSQEILQALEQLAQAYQNFNYAEAEFIDVAVAELAAAESRVDLLYRLVKEAG